MSTHCKRHSSVKQCAGRSCNSLSSSNSLKIYNFRDYAGNCVYGEIACILGELSTHASYFGRSAVKMHSTKMWCGAIFLEDAPIKNDI